jgi:hypothetical protein
MVMQIAWTAVMRLMMFATSVIVIPTQSFGVTMANAFRSCGSVILTMIAGMTVMSPPSCVANAIVQLVGAAVPAIPITAAFPSGCSVMAKTTAVMAQMSCLRTAPSVQKKATSSAGTSDVWPSAGSATLKMTAGIIQMRTRPCARVGIGSVRNQSSGAPMTNVSLPDGSATMMMTAVMAVMRRTALLMTVQQISSSAALDIASRRSSSAMGTRIVLIFQMNWTAHHAIQAAVSAQRAVLSVPTICVFG